MPEDHELNHFTMQSLFSTLTNVNFDPARFATDYIPRAVELRDRARARYVAACQAKGVAPEPIEGTAADWQLPTDVAAMDTKPFSVLERRGTLGEDTACMQELIVYGIKGAAAYAHHASVVGKEDKGVYASVHEKMGLLGSSRPEATSFDHLVGVALGVGETNLKVRAEWAAHPSF